MKPRRTTLLWPVLIAASLSGPVSTSKGQNPPAPPAPVVTPTGQTAAQAAAASMGKDVTNEQIANALRRSGLTERQVRDRLRAAGYDPALADPFFSPTVSATSQPGVVGAGQSTAFAKALEAIGVTTDLPAITARSAESIVDSVAARPKRPTVVFGKDIFDRATTAFDPITSGPVDAAYRLGIGDQLQLVVTGQVELAYVLEVRRDGTVIIPQVGQISLGGLTLDAARTELKLRMSRSYSSLNSGEARLDLTISRLRSNAVFVIGEVESPGAIQVNALATVFHALARAGGPTERGSFRDVELRRAGRVIQRLDLYDYLLRGDATGDVRLEQGDNIFVPIARRVVAVTGEVRRPRAFELRDGEGFDELLRFSGGLLPNASSDRVQVDRILPSELRAPGVERTRIDVWLGVGADSLRRVRLLDGDIVRVFSIGDLRRRVVQIEGQIYAPGEYQLAPGTTLGKLIAQSQGFLPWALADRVKVVRQIPATGRSELFSVDATTETGRAFVLSEFDAVEVLDGRLAFPGFQIQVVGAVAQPGIRPFVEHETLRDAIERAGGLREDAAEIVVSRRRTGPSFSDTTSIEFKFAAPGQFFKLDSRLVAFQLERDDRIFVRSSPGFRPQQFVTLSGQFHATGPYPIAETRDRVADVVRRAGGLLPGANPASFRVIRQGRRVAVELERAERGDPSNNITLLGGDSLIVDRDARTVLVEGGVGRPSLIRFREGLSVSDYIAQAGGANERGEPMRAIVQYPSGYSRRIEKVGFFFHIEPQVVSGATITVPERELATATSGEVWTRILAITSTLASIVLAYAAATR